MDPRYQKYFDILTTSVDALVKSSNIHFWAHVHEVFDMSIKTFHHIAHKTNFKITSQQHREYVLLTLTFLITKLILYDGNKQKRLKGGVRIHLQRGRNQAPRTHKVHHRQDRPHAKTFKEHNRQLLARQMAKQKADWAKQQAEIRIHEFLAQPQEAACEAVISHFSSNNEPNVGFLLIHVFLLALKPIEFFQNLPANPRPWLHEKKTTSTCGKNLVRLEDAEKPTDSSLVILSGSRHSLQRSAIRNIDVKAVEVATQLSDPSAAVAEILSVLPMEIYKGPSTSFINDTQCPTVTHVPLNGTLSFSKEDVHTLQVLDILTWTNYSHGEFGCLMNYNTTGQLTLYPILVKGQRASTLIPLRNDLENKTVAFCHLHPHDTDRVFSPPSVADFNGYVQNLVVWDIPYSFVFTSNGYFIISLQDNIVDIIHTMYMRTNGFSTGPEILELLNIKGIFSDKTITDSMEKEISGLMSYCSDIPSGLLSVGQNVVNLDITTSHYGKIKMTTGFNIHFINNEDLRQGRMIPLPLIKKFSKIPSPGLTGAQLSSGLARTFGLAGNELSMLTNKTHASHNLFYHAWTQLNETEQKEYLVVINHMYDNIRSKITHSKVIKDFADRGLIADATNPLYTKSFVSTWGLEDVKRNALHATATPEFLAEVGRVIRKEKAASRPVVISASKPVLVSHPVAASGPKAVKRSFFGFSVGATSPGGGSRLKNKHVSMLDKPGIITKMIFGENVKETMFMNLPYPLNLLKQYI